MSEGISRNWLFAASHLVYQFLPASRQKFTAQVHWVGWSACLAACSACFCLVFSSSSFRRLVADRPCPVIISCRRAVDGGKYSGGEEQRHIVLVSIDIVPCACGIGAIPRKAVQHLIDAHVAWYRSLGTKRLPRDDVFAFAGGVKAADSACANHRPAKRRKPLTSKGLLK